MLEHVGATYEVKTPDEAPDGAGFVAAPAIKTPNGVCITQLPKICMVLGDELGLAPASAPGNAKYGQLLLDAADLLTEVFGDKDEERYKKWFTYLEKTLEAAK